MTNDQLKIAFRIMDDRLNELEKLTDLLSRWAEAAEKAMGSMDYPKDREAFAVLCRETYHYGIRPAGE